MPVALFGNRAAVDNGKPIGEQVTVHVYSESDTYSERLRTITHDDGVWVRVSTEQPAWVACEDERLGNALAAYFGCPVIPIGEAQQHFAAAHAGASGISDADLEALVSGPAEDTAAREDGAE